MDGLLAKLNLVLLKNLRPDRSRQLVVRFDSLRSVATPVATDSSS